MRLFKIRFLKSKSKRSVVALGSGSAADASAGSRVSASTGTSTGLSHAASEICLQLDKLLHDIDYGKDAEDLGFSFDKYLQKLEQVPNHRTDDDLKLYSFTDDEQMLLKLALEASSRAHQENYR